MKICQDLCNSKNRVINIAKEQRGPDATAKRGKEAIPAE
jgi:hypothetical protein